MTRWKPDAAERLMTAAMTAFTEQGYEATTVADIAERAGLNRRTFFRYFTDKREVLFSGSAELTRMWLEAAAAAPPGAPSITVATAGFDPVAAMFTDLHTYARDRSRVITGNRELRERELIKLQTLAGELTETLKLRGIPANAATLAAQASVTVFHTAFAQWVDQDDPAALRALMTEHLEELRSVVNV